MKTLMVCAALVSAAMTASASIDTGLLAMAPANAQLIVGIDVQNTRNSQFGQYMLSKSQTDDMHLQQFIDKTGFDPRRDLQNIMLFAVGNNGGSGNGPSAFAVLARGVFDQTKIAAASKNGVAQTISGVPVTVYGGKNQTTALAFPQVGVAVMADLTTMQQILANLSTPTVLSAALTARINTIGNANDAWFVSTTGPNGWKKMSNAATGQFQAQAQALQSIKAVSGGMKSGATVDVSFDATARSAEDASSLSDVFRFMASAVQMQRQQNPGFGVLASSLDNMQLTTSGDTVHLAFSIPEKSLEQLADLKH